MKAKMILAEAATGHPDGTFSLLRGGITHIWGVKPPIGFRGVMVVRIEGDMGDKGPHRFDIAGMDQDGKEFLPRLDGQFEIAEGGGIVNIMLGMQVGFPAHGEFVFVARVDDVQQDDWKVSVKPKEESPGKT